MFGKSDFSSKFVFINWRTETVNAKNCDQDCYFNS